MRIIFMGTPDFAVPTLRAVLEAGHEVAAVYTQPPRAAGRGLNEKKSPVQVFAEGAGLTVRTPARLKGSEEQERFRALGADAAIVVAYGLILPRAAVGGHAPWRLQPPCLASAALARRGAHQPRHHGGR